MRPDRLPAFTAVLIVVAMLGASYSVLCRVEMHRGMQVYPPGFLSTVSGLCLGLSVLSLGAAAWIGWRRPKALFWNQAGEPGLKAESERRARPWAVLLTLGLALGFTAAAVHHSRLSGRLAFPPYYDDVGYFSDGLNRLYRFYDDGVSGFIRQYREAPPHSPTSSLLAASGYALLGTEDWVPPMMNFLIVFGILSFVRSRAQNLSWGWALPVYAFALAWPLVYLSVIHCMPDYITAFSLAIAGLLALEKPLSERSTRGQFGLGLLFGLAFFSKPASCLVTGFYVTATVFLVVMVEFLRSSLRGLWRQLGAPLLLVLAGCLVVCGPHYLVGYKDAWGYFMVNAMGPRQDLWKYRGNLTQQILYYITGDGADYSMGRLLIPWILLLVVAAVYALRFRRRLAIIPALAMTALFLFAYAAVSITSYKSVWLGTVIPATFFATGVAVMASLLGEAQNVATRAWAWLLRLTCVAVASLAIWQFHPIPMKSILSYVTQDYPRSGVDFIREGTRRRLLVTQIRSIIHKDPRPDISIGWVRANLYNLHFVFYFQFQKDRTRNVACLDLNEYGKDNQRFLASLSPADYLFYLSAGDKDEQEFRGFLDAQGGWQLVERINDPEDGGAILFMGRTVDWQTVSLAMKRAEGFSDLEGPYAPVTYPVRWGLGPRSRIFFATERSLGMSFDAEVSSFADGQKIEFVLDGRSVGAVALSKDFTTVHVPFQVESGQHSLELRYAMWKQDVGVRPIAALFRKFGLSEYSENRVAR